MPNVNVFQKNARRIKRTITNFGRSVKQEWALFWSAPDAYIKNWILARYEQLDFWYTRTRKTILTFKELGWAKEFTDWLTNASTGFIEAVTQAFFKYPDGELSKTVKEAADALEQKKKEITAEFEKLGKTKEEIDKEIGQWESSFKHSPLSLFFKLFNAIFDLTDAIILFVKTFKKVKEIDARIELDFIQKTIAETEGDIHPLLLNHYKKAYEKVILTARDPLLARAFLEVYKISLKELGVAEADLANISEKFFNIRKKYEKTVEAAKHAQSIASYDVNLKALRERHELYKNNHPEMDEAKIPTKFNHITNLVEVKEKAKVFEYALEILKTSPLFSEIKENKHAQQKLFSKEWKVHYTFCLERTNNVKTRIKTLKLSLGNNPQEIEETKDVYNALKNEEKIELEALETELKYLKFKDAKILGLCDLSQISNLENSDAKQFKLITLVSSIILILNALVSLFGFAFAIASLASTGNIAPVLKSATNLFDTITGFVTDKSVTFVDVALNNTFGLFRTWKKWNRVRALYSQTYENLKLELLEKNQTDLARIQELKDKLIKAKTAYEKARQNYENDHTNQILLAIVQNKKTILFDAKNEYHRVIGKKEGENSSKNELLVKLKSLRALKHRFEQEKLKLTKKNIAALSSAFMFITSVIAFFIPATAPLAIILGAGAFIVVPAIKRLLTEDGIKEIRDEAIKLRLLPKDSESFQGHGVTLWLYVTMSFLFKFTIEGLIKNTLVIPTMKIIDWLVKKAVQKPRVNQLNINENEGHDGQHNDNLIVEEESNDIINEAPLQVDSGKGIENAIKKAEEILSFSYWVAYGIKKLINWFNTPREISIIQNDNFSYQIIPEQLQIETNEQVEKYISEKISFGTGFYITLKAQRDESGRLVFKTSKKSGFENIEEFKKDFKFEEQAVVLRKQNLDDDENKEIEVNVLLRKVKTSLSEKGEKYLTFFKISYEEQEFDLEFDTAHLKINNFSN